MRRMLLVLVGTAIIAAMLAFGSAGSAFGQISEREKAPVFSTDVGAFEDNPYDFAAGIVEAKAGFGVEDLKPAGRGNRQKREARLSYCAVCFAVAANRRSGDAN